MHGIGRGLKVGIAVLVLGLVAGLGLYFVLAHHQNTQYIDVDAPYAFVVQENGKWVVEDYQNGSIHVVGIYDSIDSPGLSKAVNAVYEFDQQYNANLVPIIVVGAGDMGKPGVVQIPVNNGTLDLNQINYSYKIVIATAPQYENSIIQALETGYKLTGHVGAPGTEYLLSHDPQVIPTLEETAKLQDYSPQYTQYTMGYAGQYVIETNKGTILPYALLDSYGQNLPFVQQAISTFYNGGQ